MAFTPFPPRQPTASAPFTADADDAFDDWALATITGADSENICRVR